MSATTPQLMGLRVERRHYGLRLYWYNGRQILPHFTYTHAPAARR